MNDAAERIEEARPRRFRRYPEYRDSGVEWLGEIPAYWSALPIKRVCRFCYGESLAGNDRANGEVVVFGSNGPVGTHDSANTGAPCLIVGRKGSFGKVNYSADAVFAIDTTFVIDARYTQANLRWLYYTLQCARLDTISKDSAIPGLDREDAYARVIALGPTHDQRAIAAFLNRETARIDGSVERKERLIELLQEKRTALITRAVTRGLDPNVPMKDSGIEWLGEIPAHWEVKRLHHLLDPGKPLSYGILLPGPRLDDGTPYIGAGDVAPGKLRLEELPRTTPEIAAAYPRTRMQPGELVYAIRGSFGNVEVISEELAGVNLSRDAARIGPDNGTSSSWLKFALRSRLSLFQFGVTEIGATITGVNIRDLKRTLLAVPPNGEQLVIAAYLDRETARIDALIATIRQAIDHLKEFRTALISAAVTGKIDVREEAS